MNEARANRVADRIQEIVALLLESRVKDPRLGFVTVTDVRVTGDLREASIFYTVMGDEAQQKSTQAALQSASGMLRSEVGKALGIKHTPSLTFYLDAVEENAAHISELLHTAQKRDEELHKLAESHKPTAENPYKE